MTIHKKALQCIAAFWIILFHLWTSLTNSQMETFIIKIGYIGVDIFFLLAAYTLSNKEIEYKSFIKNRFINIYGKFILFTIIAALYKKWSLSRVIQILLGIEFLQKGGGSFLWFIPAIMIFYLVFPFFIRWKNNYKTLIVSLLWFVLGFALDASYSHLLIFINRIPIIFVGYHLKNIKWNNTIALLSGLSGFYLLYRFGFTYKLNTPFHDFYYIVAIPFILGCAYFSKWIPENKLISTLGSITLEMYALQMIVGTHLPIVIYKLCHSLILTNGLSILTILVLSYLFSKLFNHVLKH